MRQASTGIDEPEILWHYKIDLRSGVAQQAERRAVNPRVAGSSPAPGAKEFFVSPNE